MNIGLMITKDDDDIFQLIFEENCKYFDNIYVLDGSCDISTKDFLSKHPKVVYCIHESELWSKGIPPIDNGIRQPLLDIIYQQESINSWVTLLHGDELLVDDPNKVTELADKNYYNLVEWNIYNFFWHSSQLGKNTFNIHSPIWKQQTFYFLPPFRKIRQFKLLPNLSWKYPNNTLEYPYNPSIVCTTFRPETKIKHYPFGGQLDKVRGKFKQAVEGKRLRQIAFSWASTSTTSEDFYLENIPSIPGLIPEDAKILNTNKSPILPIL